MDSVSKTFCALPWLHLATNASGQVRLCCNVQPGQGLIRDRNGAPFTLNTDRPLEEIWNAENFRETRRQMLGGEWPAACGRCRREEAAGVASSRQGWNDHFAREIPAAIAATDAEGRAPLNIRYADLRLGNLCNLKCRMCNPYASRKWLEDWEQVNEPLSASETKRLSSIDWFHDPRAWDLLAVALKDCEQVYFTGGEPLLIDEHRRFLELCIANGRAGAMTLKYNTNLTLLPKELLDLWMPFKKLRLNCSLDGVGALNDYIRHPSRWSIVARNIESLNELGLRHPKKMRLTFHVTVQAYNFLRLPEILDFVRGKQGFTSLPYLNILDRPEHLNIGQMPEDLKNESIARLERWMAKNAEFLTRCDPTYVDKLRGLAAYAKSQLATSARQAEFRRFTERLDTHRKQRLSDLVPEFGAC
ncbi:MAG TPA: twitch domain-containing radical SAM protein [Bdellovibrionales bacterium]|nr:twitch domain-containing radical SAM protein [Bdellovibrionales bacterium]